MGGFNRESASPSQVRAAVLAIWQCNWRTAGEPLS